MEAFVTRTKQPFGTGSVSSLVGIVYAVHEGRIMVFCTRYCVCDGGWKTTFYLYSPCRKLGANSRNYPADYLAAAAYPMISRTQTANEDGLRRIRTF
jgi:hypothetical protein